MEDNDASDATRRRSKRDSSCRSEINRRSAGCLLAVELTSPAPVVFIVVVGVVVLVVVLLVVLGTQSVLERVLLELLLVDIRAN